MGSQWRIDLMTHWMMSEWFTMELSIPCPPPPPHLSDTQSEINTISKPLSLFLRKYFLHQCSVLMQWSLYQIFSFQPVLHDWHQRPWYMLSCLWYGAYKKPLLVIEKNSPCGGGIKFSLLLSEWSFTICLTPCNRKENVLSVSLNKTFPFIITNITLITQV